MVEKTNSVEYLPLAVIDLQEISDYITSELKAPLAPLNLLAKLEESISNLEIFPFCGSRYRVIECLNMIIGCFQLRTT